MLHFTSNSQKSLVGTAFLKAATAKMVALLSMLLFLLPTTLLANDLDKSALSNEALTAETTAEPVARAEYDKTTQTLTFLYGAPSATEDANILVVKFYNPSDNPKWFDGKYGSFDGCWGTEIKKATSVVIDDSFKNYPLASCSGMFKEFKNVITITGLGNLNTSNVTSMCGMFNYCFKLQTFDIDKLQTASVTDMANMFYNCKSLTSLDVSHFETGAVTDMSAMFKAIGDKITSLDLSNFNTQNVEDMNNMFAYINMLETLDLTSFNTSSVKNMNRMFESPCFKHIYVSELFKTDQVTRSNGMFDAYCKKLPNFNTAVLDKTHANYLEGGYFEKIVGKLGDEIIAAAGEPLTANTLTIDKDQNFKANEPFTVAAASYSRTMSDGNTWATLCLPFEVSLTDQNFRAFKLLSANDDAVELEEVKTSIAAGMPVIIKMNEGETSLNISATDKKIAQETLISATTDGSYQLQGLYAGKEFSKDTDNNCYIVKGDKLMNPAKLLENTNTTSVDSKPYRAYMVDKSSVQPAGAKMFSIEMDENVTAIDNLNILTNDHAAYYDIQGLRLNAPQKGVNIVKRGNKVMKVIIK
ncbi:MAG: BspA family leucine-rich repeat surface protein [Prevotellamassilia sp.]|nr:BspA family leucine-rich repeat surface protein [Prevotellamassilia sp.]